MPEETHKPLPGTGIAREIRAEIQQSQSTDVFFWFKENNKLQDMATVSMTVRTPAGGEMPTAIESATTSQTTDKLVIVNISAANAATRGEAYYIEWLWLTSGAQYRRRQYFDIVRHRLFPVVGDQDLGQYIPNYKQYLPQDKDGGLLQADWQRQSDMAFKRIQKRLLANGMRPSLVLDSEDLREVHELLFASIVAGVIFSRSSDDNWMRLSEVWAKDYDRQWELLPLRYDFSDSGTIEGVEGRQRARARTRLVRGVQRPLQ